jgi:hypothetical protein
VAACEQTGDCELYRLILSYDNFANLLGERVNVFGHFEMICGNITVSKRGYAEKGPVKPNGKRHCAHLLLAFVVAHCQKVGRAHFCSQGNCTG